MFLIIFGYSFNYFFENQIIFKSEISGASKVNKILKVNNSSEIPIFGSSRAQGNIVPSILGNNYFNYGIDGTQSNIWLYFLEHELKKEKNTPIIINFDLKGLIYSDGDLGNFIPNWRESKQYLNDKGEFYYTIPFIKYFGRFEKYFKYFINNKVNLTKITDKGGSFEKFQVTKEIFNKDIEKRMNTETKFKIEPELNRQFNNLIKSTNRKIILIVTPYHESCFNKFDNINMATNYLNKIDSLYNNVEVIDFKNGIKEDNLFKNTTHLNYNGAVKITQKLKNHFKN
ncbi:hypothetical protein KO506_02800 [Polaribacter vadi]|uniref:D-alanyl-lipoteichoic acid biosynthesis protein DltD n=1 Tax=Polaribacter TaxID=52959 RepID=UPI001C09EE0C|nr:MULTISPECIES: D-alanyl-lipoteichoic acid biosynthesis protein DltD [Polaribacter]MBU3010321.1 hypothetical protein [Polaribacter vadi]MDO6740128.1 D-alanyl-lipoteichoic acid biosynthesis protein DltD [Polaribacter sp. 1_MG-2023]